MTSTLALKRRAKSASLVTRSQRGSKSADCTARRMSSASESRSSTSRTFSGTAMLHPRRCLVQQQPIEAEHARGLGELLEVDGFDDVTVHAQRVAFDDVALLSRGGQHHDRNRLGARVALDLP